MARQQIGENLYLGRETGLHSSEDQNAYGHYSLALGNNYTVGEYVPFYQNTYNMSSTAGRAQYAADRAEAENTARYYEILSGYRSILDSGQNAVQSAYDKSYASALQNAVSRGLTGTTILNNLRTSTLKNQANASNDTYAKNLAAMLGFMERRNTGTGNLIQ